MMSEMNGIKDKQLFRLIVWYHLQNNILPLTNTREISWLAYFHLLGSE